MTSDSGPAFPMSLGRDDQLREGMSLRDWFAGMAMQAAIANPNIHVVDASDIPEPQVAEIAYEMADAMLKERAPEPPKVATRPAGWSAERPAEDNEPF